MLDNNILFKSRVNMHNVMDARYSLAKQSLKFALLIARVNLQAPKHPSHGTKHYAKTYGFEAWTL